MPATFNNQALFTLTPIGNATFGVTGLAGGSTGGITFCLLGDAPYTPAGGGQGGWQIVDTPRSVAKTQWYDRSPMQLTLTLLMESEVINGVAGASIEYACQILDGWQDKTPGTDQPPIFNITGPVPGIQHQWCIYTMSFDDAIRDAQAGFRTQQHISLTLYEYNSPLQSTVNAPSPAEFAAVNGPSISSDNAGGYYIYTVRSGDTLESIASALLNNYSDWQEIATLNNIRDPDNLYPGQSLQIPTS